MDQGKKTMRHFYCRDVLWDIFEQMANDFDCSIDYLINEAMRYYARSKNYAPAPAPAQQRQAAPPAQQPAQQQQQMPARRPPPPPAQQQAYAPPPAVGAQPAARPPAHQPPAQRPPAALPGPKPGRPCSSVTRAHRPWRFAGRCPRRSRSCRLRDRR